jgi:hypothetical protein
VRGCSGHHAGTVRLTLIPFAVAVALVSGCGGSGNSSSAADWANSLCSSITTWSGSVKSAGESLQGGNLSENSLKSATSDISSATDKLASDLKGLGKPDTEAGQQAKDAIDQLSSDVKDGVNAMQSAVQKASGVNGAVTAASSITATLSTVGTQISSAASKLDQADPKGELDQAFKNAPACKSLTSSSS